MRHVHAYWLPMQHFHFYPFCITCWFSMHFNAAYSCCISMLNVPPRPSCNSGSWCVFMLHVCEFKTKNRSEMKRNSGSEITLFSFLCEAKFINWKLNEAKRSEKSVHLFR
jgi:hypothetical protein